MINKAQSNKWRILPAVSYCNYRKHFPNMGANCFTRWFRVERFWSGRIININVKHHQISLDFRKNWIADMAFPSANSNPRTKN